MARRLLDLFCGQLGWSKRFIARGWECVGVDLAEPTEALPTSGFRFIQADILDMTIGRDGYLRWLDSDRACAMPFDFIVASSPCEEFSVFGMKHFHPNPKYPEMGIRLFNHTRAMCEASGAPYLMENVRPAQSFVGAAAHHCGPFFLWGNAVPTLLPQGISKAKFKKNSEHGRHGKPGNFCPEWNLSKEARKRIVATIPVELADCVAEHAERILAR